MIKITLILPNDIYCLHLGRQETNQNHHQLIGYRVHFIYHAPDLELKLGREVIGLNVLFMLTFFNRRKIRGKLKPNNIGWLIKRDQ